MLADVMRTWFGYNRWATERVLDAARGLTDEQFIAPGAEAGQKSVRDTLAHMIGAQAGYVSSWDGSNPPGTRPQRPDPAAFADLAAVRAYWEEVDGKTQAFLAGLSDADLTRVITRIRPNGAEIRQALWQMMAHAVNHATQHRSEVAVLLTAYGCSPGDLDMVFYFPSA